jgi:16S rRNA (uracil1498-N3)-methyltransferase
MHRFYLPPPQCQGPTLTLTGTEAHHAADVLRIKPGETVIVLDGAGRELSCNVRAIERKTVTLAVEQIQTSPPPASLVTLVQAIPKGKLLETIIQKATELGAARIVPLLSERVTTRLDDDDARHKGGKWQNVAIEAIKQCGLRWLPRVEAPLTLPALLARREKFDLSLVGSLQNDARHPRQYFQSFQRTAKKLPATICLWIGPEGDFSAHELEAIQKSGALPINLGPLVLRSDTAALYALSVVSYELQAPSES